MRVLLALLALSQGGGLMALQYAGVTVRQVQDNEKLKAVSKSLDFVNKVREDLRRNNDDYALLEGHNQLESAPRLPARKRSPRPHSSRRGDGDADLAPARGDGQQSNHSAAEFRSFTHLKNMRVSKLMKRLNRDKDLLRLRDPQLDDTEDTTTFTQPTNTPASAPTPSPNPRRVPPAPPAPPRANFVQGMQVVQGLSRTPAPRRPMRNRPPLPDQIDMAHARNPVITRIRLKGRLCQRTLMNMEGPTYDRNGKQVMPAHSPRLAHGRLFHQTRAPDLVLPKCCNCCKKSVLGCQ